MEESGKWTKAVYPYQPYFFLLCADEVIKEIMFYLNSQYEKLIEKIDAVNKEDLELVNHLSGKTQRYLKLSFKNVTDLMTVR
jgi:DNA polymerase epsilon subunit 1